MMKKQKCILPICARDEDSQLVSDEFVIDRHRHCATAIAVVSRCEEETKVMQVRSRSK